MQFAFDNYMPTKYECVFSVKKLLVQLLVNTFSFFNILLVFTLTVVYSVLYRTGLCDVRLVSSYFSLSINVKSVGSP